MFDLPGDVCPSCMLIALTVVIAGFPLYYFIGFSSLTRKWMKTDSGSVSRILFQHCLGASIFGGIPLVYMLSGEVDSLQSVGLGGAQTVDLYWILLLSAIIIPLTYYSAKTETNLEQYPLIREHVWSPGMLALSALGWMLYLSSYELLFRGFLFFTSLAVIGLWPAILLNTLLYSLVHLPKGKREILGAIPLGFVLCLITYSTGTIVTAVIIHIIMALSNEWFSITFHPAIKIVHKKV